MNIFNSVKLQKPKSSVFDLSHDVKFSMNMGELIPVCCFEAVPGDRFKISAESLIRFAPLVSPVMHRFDSTIHYFFVPNRILWPQWEKFITNTELTPGSGDVPAMPYIWYGDDTFPTTFPYNRLLDYMGLPVPGVTGVDNAEKISALPFAAYQKIYDEYYRDQNLISEKSIPLISGQINKGGVYDWLMDLNIRAWEHDYFTGSLPFAQKGPAVDIPLGLVKVNLDATSVGQFNLPGVTTPAADGPVSQNGGVITIPGTGSTGVVYDPNDTLEIDATTINDLRRAFKLQEWFERNARGGTRYIEHILAHFGVRSSDKRLQRPEYITGVKSPVMISEVLNTTGPSDELPQGNMAGHGISVMSGNYGSFFCEEHGYIIGIMSVMPKTAYQQGIPKHFLKLNGFEDFFYPTFAHLGEQEVQNREIYAFQSGAGNNTFGYVPRYAEYKFLPSRVAGDFRTTLKFWHNGRIFDTPPALNEEFINCVPRTDLFAVTDPDVQKLYVHVLNKVQAVRPMPKFGTPSFG